MDKDNTNGGIMAPKTKMTPEQVAAEIAEKNKDKEPPLLRPAILQEVQMYKSVNDLRFKTGRLKK